jgi:hypothetical protein
MALRPSPFDYASLRSGRTDGLPFELAFDFEFVLAFESAFASEFAFVFELALTFAFRSR